MPFPVLERVIVDCGAAPPFLPHDALPPKRWLFFLIGAMKSDSYPMGMPMHFPLMRGDPC